MHMPEYKREVMMGVESETAAACGGNRQAEIGNRKEHLRRDYHLALYNGINAEGELQKGVILFSDKNEL